MLPKGRARFSLEEEEEEERNKEKAVSPISPSSLKSRPPGAAKRCPLISYFLFLLANLPQNSGQIV